MLRQKVTKDILSSGVHVNNFRVTQLAIEFDLFVDDVSLKDNALRILTSAFGPLLDVRDLTEEGSNHTREVPRKEDVVRTSVELFNQQRYWECHEVLELIWREEKNQNEKDLLQGIILAASALVHAQKNELAVCFGMIPRALVKLDQWKQTNYFSINVNYLKAMLRNMLQSRRISFQVI